MGASRVADNTKPSGIDVQRRRLRDQPTERAAHILKNAGPRRTDLARQAVIDSDNRVAARRQPWPPAFVLSLRAPAATRRRVNKAAPDANLVSRADIDRCKASARVRRHRERQAAPSWPIDRLFHS